MSREDIAKEIYYDNFCLERGHGVSYKWEVTDDDIKEKCFLLADYIEAEIKKARVEVANKAIKEFIDKKHRDTGGFVVQLNYVRHYFNKIISANTEGE